MISPISQNRLVRAAMDLEKRVASIRLIMTDFEFPFLFIGTMSSKTSDERKEGVRFEAWKSAFLGFRKNYLGMLRNDILSAVPSGREVVGQEPGWRSRAWRVSLSDLNRTWLTIFLCKFKGSLGMRLMTL